MTIDDWRARYDHLNAETDRLRAEVERLREDAARARWCEEHYANVFWQVGGQYWFCEVPRSPKAFTQYFREATRNAAIDAARGVKSMDLDKVDLMTEIDSLRRGWQACEARLAAVEAERDAARAGEARSVDLLKRIHEMNKWLRDNELTPLPADAVYTGSEYLMALKTPALDWLAQQRREAAAEALEKLEAECGFVFDGDLPHVTIITILEHLAALRAGEVAND